ncbi:MAG: TetR/AcrR family transcriptional regulator [Candidatus Dormibacteria bacterium]
MTDGEKHRPKAPARAPYDIDSLTDVALRVFADRGFDAATMDDVARAAGITKASIYHHVSGKEALLERGLSRALEALFAVLDEPPAAAGEPLDRLRFILRRVATLAVELLPELTVLVRIRGNSRTERTAIERRRQFDAAVVEVVRAAQAAGGVDSKLDGPLIVRLMFGMVNSLVEWYRPTGRLPIDAIAETIVRTVIDGVAPRGARG